MNFDDYGRHCVTCIRAIGLIALLGVASSAIADNAPNTNTRTAALDIAGGAVRGVVTADGVREYLGIPYAAPPVGNLRWMPPQAPAKWANVKDVVKFGNSCPQTITLVTFAAKSDTEDCLYLNVFAPDGASGKLPVMVWIYGGALVDGAADPYDPTALVKSGVIVVTFNYRVNFLGFFAVPQLDAERHSLANYGLMDQQFALQWVHDNISAFGGDPRNVTIFGESAGGLSVLANLASPTARGLFQRAIVESPANGQQLRLDQPDLAEAEQRGMQLAEAVGCRDASISCLRKKSITELQRAVKSYPTSFIVDGKVLSATLRKAFEAGQFSRVPIIIGNNSDERRFPVAGKEIATGKVLDADGYTDALKQLFPKSWQRVAQQYPLSNFNYPSTALAAATGDAFMLCPTQEFTQQLTQYVPTYAYVFGDRTAPMFFPPVSFPYGAVHTAEIQYLFRGYHGAAGELHPLNALQTKLSDQMVAYWTAFAANGNPNNAGLPQWPEYRAHGGAFQLLVAPSAVAVPDSLHGARHRCEFWRGDLAGVVSPRGATH